MSHHFRLMSQFKRLLERNQNLTGKTLEETAIFFLGHQCFTGLSEEDKTLVYEKHQEELREVAREHFIELLQENAMLFSKYEQRQVMEEDLAEITARLQNEPRFVSTEMLTLKLMGKTGVHVGYTHAMCSSC